VNHLKTYNLTITIKKFLIINTMKKRKAIHLLLICLIVSIISAQEKTKNIKGIVISVDTGLPISNVTVKNLINNHTVLTNTEGIFSIATVNDNNVSLVFDNAQYIVAEKTFNSNQKNIKVALKTRKLSAATARWLDYIETDKAYNTLNFYDNPEWKIEFQETLLKGDFAPDSTYVRRDPSAVIKVGDTYYTYFTRGTRYGENGRIKFFPWAECDVWCASSKDGITWKEEGLAVGRGAAGTFDDESVFTPEILEHKGKYYLVYQCVKAPYVHRVKNTVGMAVAHSPLGPWKKIDKPILEPTNNGMWDKGTEDEVTKKGDFDSHKVHDPCLLFYNNKFYLYYKGERMGEEKMHGQREIKWGVAISENPEGPYIKSEYNPITNSGHEVCVWPYNGGIALIHTDDGPERHTIQWSPDGINFEIMGTIGKTPKAFGIFRTKNHDKNPIEGIKWGLCHAYGGDYWRTSYNYIKRFEIKN
jgi:hypothetical protein